MSQKRRLKKLEQQTNIGQQKHLTIMIFPTEFPFNDDLEQCANYKRKEAKFEESGETFGFISINCQICEEDCEHAK